MILPIFFAATVAASAAAAPTAALPAGHPQVARNPRGGNPNALFRPPADSSDEDPNLPAGTIRIELRDPLDHPLPHHAVEVGIMHQSVAKGESHEHRQVATDDAGVAQLSGLETGSNLAYRVTSHQGEATYAAMPFRLPQTKGIRVVLHVYPVMRDLPHTMQIGARCVVALELKDDRLQVEERIDFYNGLPAAWVPHDVVLRLPDGFTAVNGMQQMSDIGVDPVAGHGARIHGTFVPGDNVIDFSWQLPYSGQSSIDFEVGMPPAVREAYVEAAATPEMKLEVAGFQEAVAKTTNEGQRELVTGRRLSDNEPPLRSMHIVFNDLPTPGPTRLIATILAALAVAAGIYVATQKNERSGAKSAIKRDRARILEELDQLELAHEAGDVGPKTYERARRELVDELAGLLASTSK